MGFFNDLSKKTTETTTKIAREAKLKMKITENKGKIKGLYEDLGKRVYENHVREEKIDIKEIIKDDCTKIDDLSKEIEDARKEILELNNKVICKKCFAEIEKSSTFCPKCGEKQKEETVFEKAEIKLEETKINEKNKEKAKIVEEELKEKNGKK